MSVERASTVIVGAGPAGLAAAACLARAGLRGAVVLEARDQVASSWRGHYDRLHLHTVKRHSGLPYMPMPEAYPSYPSRQEVVDYLDAYAKQFEITPRFGQKVLSAKRVEGRWRVETADTVLEAENLVIASGYNREPVRPAFPGLESFEGEVVHSSAFKNGAHLRGKDVLVVGCGNSGAELAIDLHENGARPWLVIRSPIHVAPRDLFGRPSQETGILLSRLPLAVADFLAATTLRLAVGDLSKWGIQRPKKGPIRLIEEDGRVSMLDIGTLALIKSGDVRVVPGVRAFTKEGVTFVDGRTQSFAAVVLATGFKPALSKYLEGADALLNARGQPKVHGREALPGLYFTGFRNPPTGALREMGIEAKRIAAAIAATPRRGAERSA